MLCFCVLKSLLHEKLCSEKSLNCIKGGRCARCTVRLRPHAAGATNWGPIMVAIIIMSTHHTVAALPGWEPETVNTYA
jgi:ferredoxin